MSEVSAGADPQGAVLADADADADAADASAMRALARLAYGGYVERIGREPAPMTADYDRIASSDRALLLRDDGELAAVLVIDFEPDALLIENIAVHPDRQGTGLGSLLLRHAEALARQAGRSEVRLSTNEAMVENLAYYRRRGFVEIGRGTESGFRPVHLARRIAGAG